MVRAQRLSLLQVNPHPNPNPNPNPSPNPNPNPNPSPNPNSHRGQIEAQSEDLQGKPENIIEKIVTGRVDKSIKTKLLMAQPYIRDTDMSVEEMVKGYIAKLGENIKVTRFVRFNVGETAEEKPEEDFAAEVEKMKAGK